MGITVSVNITREAPQAPIVPAPAPAPEAVSTQSTESQTSQSSQPLSALPPAPAGFDREYRSLPANFGLEIRIYLVWSATEPSWRGIHWGADTAAYRALRKVGWGKFRHWRRAQAWSLAEVEDQWSEGLEEGDSSLPVTIYWTETRN